MAPDLEFSARKATVSNVISDVHQEFGMGALSNLYPCDFQDWELCATFPFESSFAGLT